jgi:hypothetical protein
MDEPHGEKDKIFKIIDKVLRQVFGEEATLFIYKYIEVLLSASK